MVLWGEPAVVCPNATANGFTPGLPARLHPIAHAYTRALCLVSKSMRLSVCLSAASRYHAASIEPECRPGQQWLIDALIEFGLNHHR